MNHAYPASRSHITEKEFRAWRTTKRKEDPDLETWFTPGEFWMMARLELRKPTPEWDPAEIKEHVAVAKHIENKMNEMIQKMKAILHKGTH